MAAASRKPMWKSGSKTYIPPMTNYRNVDITGKTPALGLGVPTKYLMKATVLANYITLRSLWMSTTFPTMHINLLTKDGTHHVIRHQHHKDCLLRLILLGNLIRIQIRRRALGLL